MKYYVIKNENEIQIIPVPPEQENAFIARFGGQVLVSGDSIPEALIRFNELPVVITEFISAKGGIFSNCLNHIGRPVSANRLF